MTAVIQACQGIANILPDETVKEDIPAEAARQEEVPDKDIEPVKKPVIYLEGQNPDGAVEATEIEVQEP